MFAKIGKGAVSNVLNGYNSTVFAYGQTGSGKTFTVTGGAERYGSKMSFCLAKIADSNDSSLAQRLFQMLTDACIGVLKDLDIRLLDPSYCPKFTCIAVLEENIRSICREYRNSRCPFTLLDQFSAPMASYMSQEVDQNVLSFTRSLEKCSRAVQGIFDARRTHPQYIHTLPLRQRQRRYVDRGIIPRALSLIFAEFKERSDQQFTCHISYLEIYNEQVCPWRLVC